MDSKTDKTFKIEDGDRTYTIKNLSFNPTAEVLTGIIELDGKGKKSKFYINFSNSNKEDTFDAGTYKEDDGEDIYGVLDKFYSEHTKESISVAVENGNFILTKKITFK